MRSAAGLLACASMLCAASWAPAGASDARALPAAGSSWTVYHGDPAGSGVAAGIRAVNTSRRAWTSPTLDGTLYGEPLVFGGRVYVATEHDTVYALSGATGAIIWSAHLGRPVPATRLPCGNIGPTVGITGTPVIDPGRGEIFVVADELKHGKPAHVLAGLSTASGRRELAERVDPPHSDPAALLQRTGLTLDRGQVYFGFGGNYGDCGSYRGRVAGVPEAGGKPRFFTVDAARGDSQGAVWMGGAAPAVDGAGHLWVSTGNGSVHSPGQPYDHSDGLLKLSPSLRVLQFFAPRDWATENSEDLDMSTEPWLLPDGQVIVSGKDAIVYLLNAAHLGGISAPPAKLNTNCTIDGGGVTAGMTVYLPCLSGPVAVRARKSPPGLRLLWAARAGGGPPIMAGGLIWTIGTNGELYGLSPANGTVRKQAAIGAPATDFPTPGIGDGLLLAASARRVVAFRTSASAAAAGAASGTRHRS
ncbi:MAG: PQQ-binding-like beta-propeller repeat protein [Streptosporangiaceae bacterium]